MTALRGCHFYVPGFSARQGTGKRGATLSSESRPAFLWDASYGAGLGKGLARR